jgi:PadR family transcriptional regulator, regulatory protein AphA
MPIRFNRRSEGVAARSSTLDPRGLTTSEYAVLGLLSFGEKSGYELFRFAERSVGFIWAPAKSQIYKVLPRLVAMGLARVRAVEQAKRPDKQLYRLTPAGRRALRHWLAAVAVEDELDLYLLKIFFGRQAPHAALVEQVAALRDASARRLERYEELDRQLARNERNALPLQVLAHGLLRTRATLAWADTLLAELAGRPGRAGPARGAA